MITLVVVAALSLSASFAAYAEAADAGRDAQTDAQAEAQAQAEAEADANERRWTDWVPAVGFTASFTAQGHDSEVSSTCDRGGPASSILAPCTQALVSPGDDPRDFGPTLIDTPSNLRDPTDGSDLPLWPSVGLDFQLASPVVVELPFELKPRMFVGATVTAAFPPTRTIATEGNLGRIREPDTLVPSQGISTVALEGAGSHTETVPQTWEYSAHAGISIPIEFRGRTINIKPMFGWAHWKLDVTGRVSAAVKDDVNGTAGSNTEPFGTNTREIYLKDSTTLDVNGIGPGLEIEYVSGQFGDLAAAVFMSANAYKVLGKRDVELDDDLTIGESDVVPGPDGLLRDTYRGHWEHSIDPWFYRVRLGLRVHYNPQ